MTAAPEAYPFDEELVTRRPLPHGRYETCTCEGWDGELTAEELDAGAVDASTRALTL